MFRSIRWRLQLWYATVLLTVIVSFTGLLYYQARAARLQQIDAQLLAAARYLDANLRAFPPHELDGPRPDGTLPPPPPLGPPGDRPPRPGPPPPPAGSRERQYASLELRSLPAPDAREPEDWPYFVIWRADGSVVKASDPGRQIAPPPRQAAPDRASPEFRCIRLGADRAAVGLGPHRTLVLVGKSTRREFAELDGFAWRLAGSGVVALAVGLVGGWLISTRILRPLATISATAASISATNLSRRLDTANVDRELAELAGVLNEMFGRLEASFERQVRFTADASHELRTPLAVLYSHAELALARPRSEEDYRDTLKSCLNAAARMRALVDGLLTLARADAGRLDLARQPLDLCRVAEEAAEQYAQQANQAGVALAAEVPDRPVRVSGDAVFLARVAENLLANALRHTPAGGQVRVAVAEEKGRALLSVADTGSGIPTEDQPRIFERFFRVDKARSRASGGLGLGLAICKSLTEAHGGTIRFTSQPGQGTTFVVDLPLTAP
jgi:two-component system, OmpR family, sensor kinase